MSAKRVTFRISFELPPGCTVAHAQETLADHLSSMGGDLRPPGADPEFPEGDSMFDLDRSTITVVRYHERKK
jgi:hypothetical protein